jgi:hypothetical protein
MSRDFSGFFKYILPSPFINIDSPSHRGSGMKSSSRHPRSLLFPAVVVILLTAGGLWFLFTRNSPEQSAQKPSNAREIPTFSAPTTEPSAAAPAAENDLKLETAGNTLEQSTPAPSPLSASKDNIPVASDQIKNFYRHLDQQKYIQARHLNAPSQVYFTTLIQKLLDTPPVVIRETDDLLTILKNNTHFFKILGKDNILLMKEILNQEQDKIEDLLASYFLLTTPPISSGQAVSLNIPEDSMFKYASFFLNTMGGRLYLTRRDSGTRMLISYYALLIAHQANLDGKNQDGLQLQPAVDLLTAEMETGGRHLRYQEAYLDKLYDLKEKYQ